jgi:hypothetical protein
MPHGRQGTTALRSNHLELAATSRADRGSFRSADHFPDQPDFFTGERDGCDGIAGCHTNFLIHRSAAGSFLPLATAAAEAIPTCRLDCRCAGPGCLIPLAPHDEIPAT